MKFPEDFSPPEGVKTYQSTSVVNWYHNGIFHIYALPNVEHTLEEAQKQIILVKELVKNEKVSLLLDIRNTLPIPADARNFYGTPEVKSVVKQTAVLISSPFNKVIANFYLGVFNSSTKTKTFTSMSKSISWLNKSNG